jgi:hypothetical protein
MESTWHGTAGSSLAGGTMMDFLAVVIFGWPAILTTAVLALIGLLRNNYRLLVAAAVLALPFSWFLSGFPVIQSWVFLLPLLPFGSGFLMYRGREMLAWLLAVPFFLVILLLFYVVSAQAH